MANLRGSEWLILLLVFVVVVVGGIYVLVRFVKWVWSRGEKPAAPPPDRSPE